MFLLNMSPKLWNKLWNGSHYLIPDVGKRDVVVNLDGGLVVHQQVEDVGDCGGDPAPPLVEELVEALRAVCVGVAGGRVLDPVAPLEQQGAQPTVLALDIEKWH